MTHTREQGRRKTHAERDLLNARLRVGVASSRRVKIAVVNEWATAYLGGVVPESLLESLGVSEWKRGFTDGVADANGDDR